jgi:septum formation protein
VTEVVFSPLSEELITRYVASGEPMDKAGAYGIQDTAALWIKGIRGDYFNVVGLPVYRLEQVLKEHFCLSLWGNT